MDNADNNKHIDLSQKQHERKISSTSMGTAIEGSAIPFTIEQWSFYEQCKTAALDAAISMRQRHGSDN